MPDVRDLKPAPSESSSPEKPRPAFHPKRLLLAEDDAAFRELLRQSLMRAGYEVVAVADGTELLEQLAKSRSGDSQRAPFDVVVSDVRMPGWTGMNALATLRSRHQTPPVILITAFGDEPLHEQAKRAGAVAVFDKPFDIDDLHMLLDRLTAS
jgi:two-component system response regulator (stage 0 sporulation protein F)